MIDCVPPMLFRECWCCFGINCLGCAVIAIIFLFIQYLLLQLFIYIEIVYNRHTDYQFKTYSSECVQMIVWEQYIDITWKVRYLIGSCYLIHQLSNSFIGESQRLTIRQSPQIRTRREEAKFPIREETRTSYAYYYE